MFFFVHAPPPNPIPSIRNLTFEIISAYLLKTQCRERTVHTQCVRRYNLVHTMEAPLERNESASNRQLERRRNDMELSRNANVAVRSPWKRR